MTRNVLAAIVLYSTVLAGCAHKPMTTGEATEPATTTFVNESVFASTLVPTVAIKVAHQVFGRMNFQRISEGGGGLFTETSGDHFFARTRASTFAGEPLQVTAYWEGEGRTRIVLHSNLAPQQHEFVRKQMSAAFDRAATQPAHQ